MAPTKIMTQRAIDGDHLYFVTASVQNRQWFFVTKERAATLGQAIETCCRMKMFELLAYCILPNHIHLLVRKMPQRTLERVRCEIRDQIGSDAYLFPHRRLSSRRSVNIIFRPTLSDLMKSIKGTFSRTLPKGTFWQHRSNFRIIETERYLSNVVDYVRWNYQKMNLPESYGQHPYVFIDHSRIHAMFEETT
jgi:hypothetical protein